MSETRILRTVFFPAWIDDELRLVAFHSNRTKNDLIVELVTKGLADLAQAHQPKQLP